MSDLGADLAVENARLRDTLTRVREALANHPRACSHYDVTADTENATDSVATCGWKHAVADVTAAVEGDPGRPVPAVSRGELEQFVANLQPRLWLDLINASASDTHYDSDDVRQIVERVVDVVAWFGPIDEATVPWLVRTGVYDAVVAAAGHPIPERHTPRHPGRNDLALIAAAEESAR